MVFESHEEDSNYEMVNESNTRYFPKQYVTVTATQINAERSPILIAPNLNTNAVNKNT